ncbi:membrane protein BRI3 isoform X2 [Paroedura picta]|uniref:membrane protein BRI3 isoform X2 n=1 Tax=Paroedura picta TaxID=143630 RepID=UPI004056B7D8
MDNKPLLQLPAAQPGYPPPYPYPYPYPTAPAPPPAYTIPPAAPAHSCPNNTYTIIQQPAATTSSVVVVGGCPACRVGVLEDAFTCLGIFCAIFFFPIGILFCLLLRQRRCPNCGATFG